MHTLIHHIHTGALNQERLQYFKQRLESMPPQDKALGVPPPFLYGTHYSTPGIVLLAFDIALCLVISCDIAFALFASILCKACEFTTVVYI